MRRWRFRRRSLSTLSSRVSGFIQVMLLADDVAYRHQEGQAPIRPELLSSPRSVLRLTQTKQK